MGGWLGRVAALYKMSVVQLCDDYGLDLAREAGSCGWLVQAPVGGENLARLAWLARLDEETLHQIQTPAAWVIKRHAFPYCAHCLFVNPVDVTAPRWKREWLDPAAVWCDAHRTRLALAPSVKLSR